MAKKLSKKASWPGLVSSTAARCGVVSSFRHSQFESLEPRQMLSAAPTLAPIADVTLNAGSPLYIALDGYDADGDALSYSIESTNSDLSTLISDTNRSMVIHVEGYGDMVFELFENLAPETTARIIELAESGFYDDLLFHRVASYDDGTPFVIQGGDPNGDGTGGSGVSFDDEFNPLAMHTDAGVLSMAKSDDDTNDSQFFITASATRFLDFNHSVFGYLVEGESVRAAIQDVDVDDDGKPLTDVVIDSVEIILDEENGVLILSAPEGYTGEADVTVTVDDGNGGTTTQTFHVTIEGDTVDDNPYLEPIAPIEVNAGSSSTITLGAVDLEGSDLYFAGYVSPDSDDIQFSIDSTTGQVTITADSTAGGIYGILVGVRADDGSTWDIQAVPVLVAPATPTEIDLLSTSDTGTSDSDDLTSLNNTSGKSLSFRVSGVANGATVSLYADGQLIGQNVVGSDIGEVVVYTNESFTLTDGAHQFTAVQGFYDEAVDIGNSDDVVTLESGLSSALEITIDSSLPGITSTPVTTANVGVAYAYNVESTAEEDGEAVYSLVQAPSGMLINTTTGAITWTPANSHGANQEVTVRVKDAAGNYSEQTFTIEINLAPEIWDIGNLTVEEGSLLSIDIVATDLGDDPSSAIGLNIEAGAPEGVFLNFDDGTFNWTPTEAQGPGTYSIYLRATDPDGATSTKKFTVTVTEKNESPILDPIADAVVDEGQVLEFDVTATDVDLPGNVLTYSLAAGAPAGASIGAAGHFTWQPGEQHGDYSFPITVIVADGHGGTDQVTFQVAVNEVDNGPEFKAVDTQVTTPGSTLRVKAEATDPDVINNPIRYEIVSGAPAGASIDSDTGLITWNVPLDQATGSVYLEVRATEILPDGTDGLSSTAMLEVQVTFLPLVSFDHALALAGDTPVLLAQTAREAADSLLFGSTRQIRFVAAKPAAIEHTPILGDQIGTSGGGGSRVNQDNDSDDKKEKGSEKSEEKEEKPKHSSHGKTTSHQVTSNHDFDGSDDSTEVIELAPAELLDAAYEQLAEERVTTG